MTSERDIALMEAYLNKTPVELGVPAEEIIAWQPTGSNYICNPPVIDTDIDILIFCKDVNKVKEFLLRQFWELCGTNEYPEQQEDYGFWALRKDKYNLIITGNEGYYLDFTEATLLAKELNLLEKSQRVTLFKHIMHKNTFNLSEVEIPIAPVASSGYTRGFSFSNT